MGSDERTAQPGDEAAGFTEEELTAAFRLVTSADEASELAREMKAPREPSDHGPPWLLSPDVLELLLLVSDDCAQRAGRILGLSDADLAIAAGMPRVGSAWRASPSHIGGTAVRLSGGAARC